MPNNRAVGIRSPPRGRLNPRPERWHKGDGYENDDTGIVDAFYGVMPCHSSSDYAAGGNGNLNLPARSGSDCRRG
jgi:hypothetical protein